VRESDGPIAKLPASVARKFFITARERRDLESRFKRDMQLLRRRVREGPHSTETFGQFAVRLGDQLEVILERYEPYFTRWRKPVTMGRPPSFDNEPRDSKGQPQRRLAARVVALASQTGQSIPAAARELLAEEIRSQNATRSRQFEHACDGYQRDEALSPAKALVRVFAKPVFRAERKQLDTLIRTARKHLERRRSVGR
jgi:hypothetical protein